MGVMEKILLLSRLKAAGLLTRVGIITFAVFPRWRSRSWSMFFELMLQQLRVISVKGYGT